MPIAGNVTTAAGVAADLVRVFQWPDQKLVGTVEPDTSGDWSFQVPLTGEYGVTYLAAGCQPITHGPYYVELELWNPSLIPTALWLDASDSNSLVLDTEGGVEQWLDKSGNSRHASQDNELQRPSVALDAISGQSAVSFNGSGEKVFLPEMTPDRVSIFVVVSASDLSGQHHIIRQGNSPWNWILRTENANIASYFPTSSSGPAPLSGNRFVFCQTFDGTHHRSSANGSLFFNSPYSGPLVEPDSYGHALGGHPRIDTDSWNGLIAEVVITYSGMTDSERQIVEGYLAWKWGLEAALPDNHPYKTAAPPAP